MKKYTKEEILKLKKKMTANLDDALEVLADLEAMPIKKSGKSQIVSEKIYYENDTITDYRQKPYQIFLFVTYFWLKLTPSGRTILEKKREVKEFSANTHKKIDKLVYDFTDQCDGELLETDSKWFPPDLIEKKKALILMENN